MKANSSNLQKGRLNRVIFGLFGAGQPKALPSFLNERILRDIGVLEPETQAHQPDAFAAPSLRDHAFSNGLTGL